LTIRRAAVVTIDATAIPLARLRQQRYAEILHTQK
jgi:hypothetical protein